MAAGLHASYARLVFASVVTTCAVGCSSVREVTPWLRTASFDTEEVHGAPYTEQLVRGRWIKVASNDEARAIRGGSLVVYRSNGYMLTNARGRGATLDCTASFRIVPGELGFVCIDLEDTSVAMDEALVVGLKSFDAVGRKTLDTRLGLEAGALARRYFVELLGFAFDGTPLLVATVADADELRVECVILGLRERGIEQTRRVSRPEGASCSDRALWYTVGLIVNDGESL